jgi:hypothetical protein
VIGTGSVWAGSCRHKQLKAVDCSRSSNNRSDAGRRDPMRRLTAMGPQVEGGAPERLSELMRTESVKWGQVIKEGHIKVD